MSHDARFESIYTEQAPAVKAYIMRRASSAIADDLLADVFTVCWRRLEDVPAEPLPWLLGVARRVLRTARRSETRRLNLRRRLESEPVAVAALPGAQQQTLGAALQRMRELDRELLLLIAWEGLTPSQAAEVLGITPEAARVRLHRARNRLRLALATPDPEPRCAERPLEASS